MRKPRVDLCTHSAQIVAGWTARCEVKCVSCTWKGRRVVEFMLNVGQEFDARAASDKIRGVQSLPCCPKCGERPDLPRRGMVHFVRVVGV